MSDKSPKFKVEIRTARWLRPAVAVYSVVTPALCSMRLVKASSAFGGMNWLLRHGVHALRDAAKGGA